MSGIYIKGMEMPKNCFECPMRWKVDPDTIKCLATGEMLEETFAGTIKTRNRGRCPLVPVPDHSDLIDADARIDVAQGQVVPRQTTIRRFLLNHVEGLLPIVVIPADEDGGLNA